MTAKLRSWWRQIKQHRLAIGVVVIALVIFIALITIGYLFNWTGFKGKTLWDWLGLLAALAIPVVVGFGAAWFTAQQGKVSDRDNKDNQHETALQAYIDKMSELLLKEHLSELKPEYEEVRKIARVRTLTVLRRLDAERRGSVLQFLYESELIKRDKRIIDLRGASLDGANLQGAYLRLAHLSGANLQGANLRGAHLSVTDLSEARLRSADLSGARLRSADLSGANLEEAELSGANLEEAELSGAILSRANLQGAIVTTVQLARAKSSEGLIMSDGTTRP